MKRIFYNKSDASQLRGMLQKEGRYHLTGLEGKSMSLKSQKRTNRPQTAAINVPGAVNVDVIAFILTLVVLQDNMNPDQSKINSHSFVVMGLKC